MHLIDGSEKRICQLTFELKSPHVIERRSEPIVWWRFRRHRRVSLRKLPCFTT